MKKLKIAVALSCALTMMLALSSNALTNNAQASNAQKTYAAGQIILYNDGSPAI